MDLLRATAHAATCRILTGVARAPSIQNATASKQIANLK